MNKQKAILILLLFLPLLFVLYIYSPFLIMYAAFDSSWYYTEEKVDIGSFDYGSVLTKAEKAGYEVEGYWPWPGSFPGFDPGDVPEVRKSFGGAALVQDMRFNYNSNSELTVFMCEDGLEAGTGTCVAVSNFSHTDLESPLQPSEFPDDSWMLEKFGLLFGPDEKVSEKDEKLSENYLETMKKAAQNQAWDVEIQVNESPDFPAVYAYLMENSDDSSYGPTLGIYTYSTAGSDIEEVFLKDGNRLGSVRYFVPGARIMTYNEGNRYVVQLDASGETRLQIIMPVGSSGETIPEDEYRAVFREMFEELGLSPEAVDRFEFFRSSSRVW
ncbi:hypothetical protein [Methanosarcina sp.]|uniref:hypothetical protein n=1 Tax=Methanosarcina sp. TaxID=2213 RepID=UPI003C78BD90